VTTDVRPDDGIDEVRLAAWLADTVDPTISSVSVARISRGHSSGAWSVDSTTAAGASRQLVLKAPSEPSVVFQRDAGREGRIVDAAGRLGAPVPRVVAIDDGTRVGIGRACFAMEHVEGRSPADSSAAGCHDDPWLHEIGPAAQRAVWDSFHDALAALHRVDGAKVPDASHGARGTVDVLAYWRAALLDAAPADTVPRQLVLLDWLRDHLPPRADDDPAVCMGDARLANCLVDGTDVRALVDFEVAYSGNPAADIGYSIFFEALQRRGAARPLPGFASADETWVRWTEMTGRDVDDRDYWTAFGVTILSITATRAMIQWGLSGASVESDNPVVAEWEAIVEQAADR
jgi:aminoglycoside phosphotransferase (APT) family kinase protein